MTDVMGRSCPPSAGHGSPGEKRKEWLLPADMLFSIHAKIAGIEAFLLIDGCGGVCEEI